MTPFVDISKSDDSVEFYDDAGELISAVNRGCYFDIFVTVSGSSTFNGHAFVKSNRPSDIYRAWTEQQSIDEFFERRLDNATEKRVVPEKH